MAGVPSRSRTAAFAAIFLYALTSLTGCANSNPGIPLALGTADPELQDLARRARAGEKPAQLELGIRYEEGRGVAPDLSRAERLYRRAAAGTPRTTAIYVPSRNGRGHGRVLPARIGFAERGLPEARRRLHLLLRRRNKR